MTAKRMDVCAALSFLLICFAFTVNGEILLFNVNNSVSTGIINHRQLVKGLLYLLPAIPVIFLVKFLYRKLWGPGKQPPASDTTVIGMMAENEAALMQFANEITEIEKIKKQLDQKEDELVQIQNSITDGFFILNKSLQVVRANNLLKTLVETPVSDVEGKYLSELFPGVENTRSYGLYLEAIATNKPVHFESLYKNNDWYRVSAYPFEGGLTIFFKNITPQKVSELKLCENNQNLLALINNTDDLIWSVDKTYHYNTYNEPYSKAYYALFGEEICPGKLALNLNQGKEHIEKWKKLYQKGLDGKQFSVDMDFLLMNTCRSVTVRFNPIYDDSQHIIGVSCFLQNITERKLHEKKIEQQNRQLKKIAFITSHKVRVPLSNILGLVEVLDVNEPLSPGNCEIIELIKQSAQLLDSTIKKVVEETISMEE